MIVAPFGPDLPAPSFRLCILPAVSSSSQKWNAKLLKPHSRTFHGMNSLRLSPPPKSAMPFPPLGHCCKEGERRLLKINHETNCKRTGHCQIFATLSMTLTQAAEPLRTGPSLSPTRTTARISGLRHNEK